MLWLDAYERRARLVPGLFTLFPVMILLAVLGVRQISAVSFVISGLTLIGGPVLVAGVVRYFGKKAESALWTSWSGPPTTVWMRLREPTDNEVQRDLWRKAVEEVSGVSLLSLRAERSNPDKADKVIETGVKRVRDRTRGKEKFELLFSENRGYGYERNLYGVRWLGRAISLTAVTMMTGYILWLASLLNRPGVSVTNLFGLAACLAFFIGWCLWPSKKRVREAANRYAHELLHAAVTLQEDAAQAAAAARDNATVMRIDVQNRREGS